MRHRTGLHNKYRTGRGSYSINKKSRTKDTYGKLSNGKVTDVIGGRSVTWEVRTDGES